MKFKFSPEYEVDTDEEPFVKKGIRIGFFATSGQGKSHTAAVLTEQWLDQGGTIVIFEPIAEWHTLKQEYPVQVIGGPHSRDLPLIESQPKLYASAVVEQGISMVFYTREIDDEEQLVKFVYDFINELMTLQEIHHRPILLILEETHQYAPRVTSGQLAPPWVFNRMIKVLKDCFTQGRKLNITPVALTQRPQEINFTIRQLINFAWFGGFSTQDASYIDKEILSAYRREGHNIKQDDIINVPTGSWTVIAEDSLEKIHVPFDMRKTPHGADTPTLEYTQPVDMDTQEAITDLGAKLAEMLEKAEQEQSELEKAKRQLYNAEKKIERLEEQVKMGSDLRRLLKEAVNDTESGKGVDPEILEKLEEKHEAELAEKQAELNELAKTWVPPEEAEILQKKAANLEKYEQISILINDLFIDEIMQRVKASIPKFSKKDIENIVSKQIANLSPGKKAELAEGITGITWIDAFLPNIKNKAEKAIIMFLAKNLGVSYTLKQLALALDYSEGSGYFQNRLSKLRKAGLIKRENDKYSIAEGPP